MKFAIDTLIDRTGKLTPEPLEDITRFRWQFLVQLEVSAPFPAFPAEELNSTLAYLL